MAIKKLANTTTARWYNIATLMPFFFFGGGEVV